MCGGIVWQGCVVECEDGLQTSVVPSGWSVKKEKTVVLFHRQEEQVMP